jgi:hypothetical protein
MRTKQKEATMAKWVAQDLRNGEWVNTTGFPYDDTIQEDAESIAFLRDVAAAFNDGLPEDHFRVIEVEEAK